MEALARDLLTTPGAPPPDFTSPPGEPALVPAASPAWRVFANPVTLFVGGVAAVLLELAEPRVRHGVWDHSSFRTDPLARLKRTGLAALVTVYGPASSARAMIERIGRLHARVSGVTDAGTAYRADDPELLDWVQATASWGFLEAFAAFDAPVSIADRDTYYADVAPVAALYGATGAPRTDAEAHALIQRMRPKLEPSATLQEFLAIMRRVPALPVAARASSVPSSRPPSPSSPLASPSTSTSPASGTSQRWSARWSKPPPKPPAASISKPGPATRPVSAWPPSRSPTPLVGEGGTRRRRRWEGEGTK